MIEILTYNDLLDIGENERDRMEFVLDAIKEHKGSDFYKDAKTGERYYKQDTDILRYVKTVTNHLGQKVPDIWSANNKIATNFYNYFTTQKVSYLLGNGVTFKNEETKKKLGKDFDKRVQDCATAACNGAAGFGFFNLDHVEVFKATEFVPLWDEDDGGLKAGIRFWQIDDSKPLRATLYEMDGYTDYIKRKGEDVAVLHEKRAYTQIVSRNDIEGETILDGAPPAGFPIVPLWNINRQTDLKGKKGNIDAYELILSGLVNTADEGEMTYWVLKGLGALDNDMSLVQFKEHMKLIGVANIGDDENADATPHTVEPPFAASAEALNRLEKQLYKDFMALKVEDITAGSVTATQIQAAYEPINQKTDQFEYQVTEFINGILALAGIDDEPTYTRSQMSNQGELLEMVLQCAEYLDDEYITTKILTLLGDADKAQEVLKRKDAEAADRYKQMETELEEMKNQNQQNNESEGE